jgi:hypothetical protein
MEGLKKFHEACGQGDSVILASLTDRHQIDGKVRTVGPTGSEKVENSVTQTVNLSRFFLGAVTSWPTLGQFVCSSVDTLAYTYAKNAYVSLLQPPFWRTTRLARASRACSAPSSKNLPIHIVSHQKNTNARSSMKDAAPAAMTVARRVPLLGNRSRLAPHRRLPSAPPPSPVQAAGTKPVVVVSR